MQARNRSPPSGSTCFNEAALRGGRKYAARIGPVPLVTGIWTSMRPPFAEGGNHEMEVQFKQNEIQRASMRPPFAEGGNGQVPRSGGNHRMPRRGLQ